MKKQLLILLITTCSECAQVEFFSNNISAQYLSDIIISSSIGLAMGFASQMIPKTKPDKIGASFYGLAATNMLVAIQPKRCLLNEKISVVSINTSGDSNKFYPRAFYAPYYNSRAHLITTLVAFAVGSIAGFTYSNKSNEKN